MNKTERVIKQSEQILRTDTVKGRKKRSQHEIITCQVYVGYFNLFLDIVRINPFDSRIQKRGRYLLRVIVIVCNVAEVQVLKKGQVQLLTVKNKIVVVMKNVQQIYYDETGTVINEEEAITTTTLPPGQTAHGKTSSKKFIFKSFAHFP